MATISELNVRLGLLYKDFDNSLKKVERNLERSGRKFSQLGNDLALSVSLPLAALGASAIKQAGEIESLKLAMVSTFESAGRSAEDATKEVEALRQAAKAPGLDFEQAVKGSIRLQGVGLAAEESRRILEQMANAIASTGGTAEDLDGVTKQFSQMIAKGRVLQEDVSILAERMPVISRLMQQAFGTASVEAIRNSGVTAKEFVARITEAAATLPRVEGGIKNALVNAASEARNSLAKLGESINKAFDVTGILDKFSESLASAVAWFDGLEDSTKRNIVATGAALIAIGPLVKVYGALSGALSVAIGGLRSIVDATKGASAVLIGMTQSTQSLSGYFTSLGESMYGAGAAAARMRISILAATAGVAAIVLGIAAAVYMLSDNFDAAEFTAKTFATATKEVREESAKEIGVLNQNIDTLRSATASTEDRKKASDDLLKAYPDYLKGINLETAGLTELKEIQDKLTSSIIRGIAERKKATAVNALYEKQADILLRIQEIQRTGDITTSEAILIDTGDLIRNGGSAAAVIEKLKGQISDIGKQATTTAADFDKAFGLQSRALDLQQEKQYDARQAAEDLRSEYSVMGGTVALLSGKTKELTAAEITAAEEAKKAAKQRAETYKNVLASIDAVNKKQAELGADFVGEKTREIENGVEKLIEAGFGPNSAPVQKLKGYLTQIRAEISKGFGVANAAQIAGGATPGTAPAAPQAIPTLATPGSVASVAIPGAEQAIKQAKELAEAYLKTGQSYQNFVDRISGKQSVFDSINKSIAEARNGTVSWGQALADSAKKVAEAWDQKFSAVYDAAANLGAGIIGLQKAQGENEKAELEKTAQTRITSLESEYAAKIAAAQGNANVVAAIEQELANKKAAIDADLAAKKEAIDKKRGKAAKALAITTAIIDTAVGVTKALGSAPPPYNFILAALTAAAGAVQVATIKAQPMAKGGVVTQPTYALMGEYPGARTNPEIVTPERLMRSVFRDEMGGGGRVEVYGIIRGSDIEISNRKAERERGRIR